MATNTLDAVRQRLAAEEAELRRRGVRHLAVFCSVARGDDRPDSDIDLAVEIEVDSFRPQVQAAFERERVPIF